MRCRQDRATEHPSHKRETNNEQTRKHHRRHSAPESQFNADSLRNWSSLQETIFKYRMGGRDREMSGRTFSHPEDRQKDGADECTLPPESQPQSSRRLAPTPFQKKCPPREPERPDVDRNGQHE